MPRLSVIMPVLDGEQFLPRTLRSLVRTLPRDAEVLVMDDGSTDSTPRLLEEVSRADRRFKVFRHEQPAGVAASLNELAAHADCDYLARMDADDIALASRWRISARLLARADFVFTWVLFIDDQGKVRGADQPGHFSVGSVPYHLVYGCCLVHPTVSMRRSAFDELGGYADTRAEDYELWMRAAGRGFRLTRSAVPGLLYRRHEGQVTGRQPWLDEGAGSPLFAAYGGLLQYVLGEQPEGWREVFGSALGSSRITPEEAAQAEAINELVAARARARLPRADAALVCWRAARERKRIRARIEEPASANSGE